MGGMAVLSVRNARPSWLFCWAVCRWDGGVAAPSSMEHPAAAAAAAVSGNYAFVASYFADSMSVVDVSNKASPTLVGTLKDTSNLAVAILAQAIWAQEGATSPIYGRSFLTPFH